MLVEVDCSSADFRPNVNELFDLTSCQIADMIGASVCLDEGPLDPKEYSWRFLILKVNDPNLVVSGHFRELPDGGWREVHRRHIANDERCIRDGSPEYAGRIEWLSEQWRKDTRIFPIFIISDENGEYRLVDGFHRYAYAHASNMSEVAVFLGSPK